MGYGRFTLKTAWKVYLAGFSGGGRILRFQAAGFHPKRRGTQQRRRIREVEFVLQMLAIGLDGLEAELQVLADLDGAQATTQQLKYL
jgi:hypothetical protein